MKNANGHTAIGVFLCSLLFLSANSLHASPSASDYQPFATRDQNSLNLIHGQALPGNAALVNEKETQWSSSLSITNTLNVESSANESIRLDYETYRLNLSYQYGLNKNWNIKFDLPVIYQGGGIFDSSINRWHNFWGLPEANRPFIENNQYDINYVSQGKTFLDLNEANLSLGDLQIATARKLIANESTAISVWASLKLPTGNKNKITGNGAADVSAWLAINQKIADNWRLNINAGTTILGTDEYQDMPLSDYAVHGHVMLGWILTESISLKVQLQGHSRYYDDSQLRILGSTHLLTFGGTIKINNCHYFDIAMSEDIKLGASPDASLLFSWRSLPSRC